MQHPAASAAMAWTKSAGSEEALVAAAREGDEAAYVALVSRYRGMVMAYALARLSSREEAEDVAQETFIRAFLSLSRLRSSACWEPWVMRIVRNLCRDSERRRRAQPTVSIEQFWPDGDLPPRAEPLPEGHLGDLDAVVAALPEKYRVPLRMHYAFGCTYREIAIALGVPESTVIGRMAGGIERLRRTLGKGIR